MRLVEEHLEALSPVDWDESTKRHFVLEAFGNAVSALLDEAAGSEATAASTEPMPRRQQSA